MEISYHSGMCYSAQVWDAYNTYVRKLGASISIDEFVRQFGIRNEGGKVKFSLGVDRAFLNDDAPALRSIRKLVETYIAQRKTALEKEMFGQKHRLAEAEHKLAAKPTKAAAESKRIATDKISRAETRLKDLTRTTAKDRDTRFYPGDFVPVMLWREGERTVFPMRYQCRPAGKPAFYDTKYPGTYNARRDNLEGFWKAQFGHTHAVLVVRQFYERVDGQELAFFPDNHEPLIVACLWSHWTGKHGEPDLYSFAAITDEPPPEVAAAGHDRCIVPIKAKHIDAWLNPDPKNLAASYAILDDRERPFYEHQIAA